MKAAEIRELSADDLQAKLKEAKRGAVQPALPDGHQPAGQHRPRVKQVKKDIARIHD
ncbi:MAG: 50S ribosomal protein L29 [Adlercreutzia equolifaciens]